LVGELGDLATTRGRTSTRMRRQVSACMLINGNSFSGLRNFPLIILGLLFHGCPVRLHIEGSLQLKRCEVVIRLRGGGLPKKRVGEFASWGVGGKKDPDFVEDVGQGRQLKDGRDPAMEKWIADDPYNKPTDDETYQIARYKSSKDPANRMEIVRNIEKVGEGASYFDVWSCSVHARAIATPCVLAFHIAPPHWPMSQPRPSHAIRMP
jgi:hypothetical protein